MIGGSLTERRRWGWFSVAAALAVGIVALNPPQTLCSSRPAYSRSMIELRNTIRIYREGHDGTYPQTWAELKAVSRPERWAHLQRELGVEERYQLLDPGPAGRAIRLPGGEKIIVLAWRAGDEGTDPRGPGRRGLIVDQEGQLFLRGFGEESLQRLCRQDGKDLTDYTRASTPRRFQFPQGIMEKIPGMLLLLLAAMLAAIPWRDRWRRLPGPR